MHSIVHTHTHTHALYMCMRMYIHVHVYMYMRMCVLYLVREKDILVVFQDGLHGIIEVRVADARAVQPREQVRDEAQEERNVLKDKLGQVHVPQCSHQHHVLCRAREKPAHTCAQT